MAGEKVLDELICFLGEPIFQIPVRTFMDEHCLIFDPSIDSGRDHVEIHARYKKLIDTLLDSFIEDVSKQYKKKLTNDDIIKGIRKMNEIPDVKEVFQVMFEQVFAALDMEIFTRVMTKRNIMIQEQVLLMIIAATGQLPRSMQFEVKKQGAAQDEEEAKVLQEAMRESSKEQKKIMAIVKKDEDDFQKTIELSKQEAEQLKKSRQEMEQDLTRLTLEDAPPIQPVKKPAAAAPVISSSSRSPQKSSPQRSQPVASPSPSQTTAAAPGASASGQTGAEAANSWMQSARSEAVTQSAVHSAMAAKFSGMSADELKKRQDFLMKQRDLLLAKKKEAREKNLGVAEKSRPQRPSSARVARSAMGDNQSAATTPASNPEDERKLAMRRAIADRLKQEVIHKH